jgi:pyrroloquinoline quinone biosynthesis protein B
MMTLLKDWKMTRLAAVTPLCFFLVCFSTAVPQESARPEKLASNFHRETRISPHQPFVMVLGIAQDGGIPQAGCRKDCCVDAWHKTEERQRVACLAIVDPESKQRWIIDCTPDFREQLQHLMTTAPACEVRNNGEAGLDGILLTHAHIGHYSGLIHLGREAIGARNIPVWAMPRMRKFLTTNGPWSQLVLLKNIRLKALAENEPVNLNPRIRVTPFAVPHRDEFSETVGFRITGPEQTVVYIPDIDKWSRWSQRIEDVIESCDLAYLDGTFFANGEIPGRDMSLIPHPFIEESLAQFAKLGVNQRRKVRFIHLNHTNRALKPASQAAMKIRKSGCSVATQGERFGL